MMLNFKPRRSADPTAEATQPVKPTPKSKPEQPSEVQIRRDQKARIHAEEIETQTGEVSENNYLLYLMEHGEIEPNTPVNFAGLEVPLTVFKEDFPRYCREIEAERGIDLKTLPPAIVADFLQVKMDTGDARANQVKSLERVAKQQADAVESEQAQAERSEAKQDAYAQWIDQFETITELIENLNTLPVNQFPELATEKAKLEPFQALLSLAHTKNDQVLIRQKMNTLSLSTLPDPVAFITTEIFSSAEGDNGFSDEMQEAVAKTFDLTHRRLKTGADLAKAMNETTTDPETGEVSARYHKDNKLLVRKTPSRAGDVYLHVSDEGERVVEVRLSDGRYREISMPSGANEADELRTYTNLLGLYSQLEEDGHTDFLGEGMSITHAITNIRDPFKRNKLENTLNALLGSTAGFDGKVLDAADYQQIGRYVNYLGGQKGDAQVGDVSPTEAVKRRTDLGIHPQGNPQIIRYEVLRTACLYMQEHWITTAPDYDALQAHLATVYPEFVTVQSQ